MYPSRVRRARAPRSRGQSLRGMERNRGRRRLRTSVAPWSEDGGGVQIWPGRALPRWLAANRRSADCPVCLVSHTQHTQRKRERGCQTTHTSRCQERKRKKQTGVSPSRSLAVAALVGSGRPLRCSSARHRPRWEQSPLGCSLASCRLQLRPRHFRRWPGRGLDVRGG